jgi:cytochrome P450
MAQSCHSRSSKADLHIGPVFRFQPQGLLFSTPTAYRTIYNTRAKVKKGKSYQVWTRNEQSHDIFSTTEKRSHAKERKGVNAAFLSKPIEFAESVVIKNVDRWNQTLAGEIMKEWTRPFCTSDTLAQLFYDIMGDLALGKSFEF